jgi:microcystin-dependent protein
LQLLECIQLDNRKVIKIFLIIKGDENMDEPILGMIQLFAFNFVPMDWMLCNGAILQINMYQALYSLIGNAYGGSQAQNTFALPNLMGCEPVPGMKYYICTAGLYPARS